MAQTKREMAETLADHSPYAADGRADWSKERPGARDRAVAEYMRTMSTADLQEQMRLMAAYQARQSS